MKKTFHALVILLIVLSSCKKPVILLSDIAQGTKLSGLAGTSWKIVASTSVIDYVSGIIIDYDLFPALPLCNVDNILLFLADGTTATDELTKCDPKAPQYLINGTWKLFSDNKTLLFTTIGQNAINLTKLDCEIYNLI